MTGQVIPAGWTSCRASAATYYTASGLLVSAAQNVPRFDHDPTTGDALGLLLESMKTNALAASTGMSIVTRCTLTQNAGEGADGTLTTTRITEDTTAGSTHYASEPFAISANVTGTYSAFYRAGSRT